MTDGLLDEMRRLSDALDAALAYLRRQVGAAAEAENVYRKACAQEALKVAGRDDLTAAAKEAVTKSETADLRQSRDIADGMRQAALEAVRSRRAQISALQTIANAAKAEAEFARTGPEVRT